MELGMDTSFFVLTYSIETHVILVLFVWQMERNTLLPKENLIILCLLKKSSLISVGFTCWVNHSLDPELDLCVIECLGFLTTNTIKPVTALWMKSYFRYMRKGLWNPKVHLLMDLHQISHVSLWRCVCNFSWNGQNYSEFTLQLNWKELLPTSKPCLRNWCWKRSCALDGRSALVAPDPAHLAEFSSSVMKVRLLLACKGSVRACSC